MISPVVNKYRNSGDKNRHADFVSDVPSLAQSLQTIRR
jgi:hypothetical protein